MVMKCALNEFINSSLYVFAFYNNPRRLDRVEHGHVLEHIVNDYHFIIAG